MIIYAIAKRTYECYGHGDYGSELKICQEGAYHKEGVWHPVFTEHESAAEYLNTLKNRSCMEIVGLNLIDDR